MAGDAPESTDPISLARQVVEDAIKLVRAELAVVGAELKRAIIQLVIAAAMIIVAAVFLLIGVIEALGALPSGLGILGAEWVRWLALGGIFLVLAAVLIYFGQPKARKAIKRGRKQIESNVEGGCRVAPGTDEAQRQRELSKQALASSAGQLEQRVRAELDWKARLRRDGPRYAAIAGGAVVLIGTIVLVRSRLRRDKAEEETAPATLDDLVAELQKLRKEIKKGGDKTPIWQKVVLRGVSAAGVGRRRLRGQAAGRPPGG